MSGGDPATSIMVGDTSTDFNAAIDAKIRCVAVDFGYHDKPEDLEAADCVISNFSELWPATKLLLQQ